MKKLIVCLLCLCVLLSMAVQAAPAVFADAEAGQPSQDDIFFDAPGGNEYVPEQPDGGEPAEDGLSSGTIALISFAAIALLCIVVGWLYCCFRKKKK